MKGIDAEVTDVVEVEETITSESKINLKDKQAILFFRKDGEEYSKIIENVEEREMIPYPSVRRPTE